MFGSWAATSAFSDGLELLPPGLEVLVRRQSDEHSVIPAFVPQFPGGRRDGAPDINP